MQISRLAGMMLIALSFAVPAIGEPSTQGPADTIWDLSFIKSNQVLTASSDGTVQQMQLTADSANSLAQLQLGPYSRVKQLVLSPDGKQFACLKNQSDGDSIVIGSLKPFQIQTQYSLPQDELETQSLLWASKTPQTNQNSGQNGLILVGTGSRRIALQLHGKSLKPVYQIQHPLRKQAFFNDSVVYQGKGWTAWSPGGLKEGGMPVHERHLILESWSLSTGKTLSKQSFDPSAFAYDDWSLVTLASSPRGLIMGLGHRGLNTVVYLQNPQGRWEAKVCEGTRAGGYPRAIVANQQTAYLAFQWPGKVMSLNLQTLKWGPELRGIEDPMALTLDDKYIYVGLRFGGLERYPLAGGKPVALYLSQQNQPKPQTHQRSTDAEETEGQDSDE